MFPPASFGSEGGVPVYVVREWAPGVEMVHEVSSDYGAPHYTPVVEYAPGVKLIMLDGDGMLAADRARMVLEQQMQAASFRSAVASQAGVPLSGQSVQIQLLLLG